MPANTYRVELKLPPEMKEKLNRLQREAKEEKGRHVPKSTLILGILGDFFEEEDKKSS